MPIQSKLNGAECSTKHVGTMQTISDEAVLDLATETLWRFLAAAFGPTPRVPLGPSRDQWHSWDLLHDRYSQDVAAHAAELLRTELAPVPIRLGFGELPLDQLDLQPTIDAVRHAPRSVADDYVRVFGLVTCAECPPYETEYQQNEDTFFRAQQMADIAGFYSAFGLSPSIDERPDHIVLELEFAAFLLLRKRLALLKPTAACLGAAAHEDQSSNDPRSICQEARVSFLRDHLHWWLPSFGLAVQTKVGCGFFAEVSRVMRALLPIERHRLNIGPPQLPAKAPLPIVEECDGCQLNSIH